MATGPEKTPIDRLLDAVAWRELAPQPTWHERVAGEAEDAPVATHEGTLEIGGVVVRVYQLSDGRRIVAAEDLERFLGTTNESEATP